MATALTQANLDTLTGYVLSGDAIGYYNQLANYGYDYGRLAEIGGHSWREPNLCACGHGVGIRNGFFRGSMAGLRVHLSTLRRAPPPALAGQPGVDTTRLTRGPCGAQPWYADRFLQTGSTCIRSLAA
jgi:hypothetical protein